VHGFAINNARDCVVSSQEPTIGSYFHALREFPSAINIGIMCINVNMIELSPA